MHLLLVSLLVLSSVILASVLQSRQRHALAAEQLRQEREEARQRLDASRLLMVGDQLATDILGAQCCGMDSALVGSGLATTSTAANGPLPTYLLSSIDPCL